MCSPLMRHSPVFLSTYIHIHYLLYNVALALPRSYSFITYLPSSMQSLNRVQSYNNIMSTNLSVDISFSSESIHSFSDLLCDDSVDD